MIDVEELVLEKIKFGVAQYHYNLHPQNLKYETDFDVSHQRMIHYLSWNLLGKTIETKRYPSTWWDAFKDRWFPRFLKNRLKVNYDEFKLYAICPHINKDFGKSSEIHFKWLSEATMQNIRGLEKEAQAQFEADEKAEQDRLRGEAEAKEEAEAREREERIREEDLAQWLMNPEGNLRHEYNQPIPKNNDSHGYTVPDRLVRIQNK